MFTSNVLVFDTSQLQDVIESEITIPKTDELKTDLKLKAKNLQTAHNDIVESFSVTPDPTDYGFDLDVRMKD